MTNGAESCMRDNCKMLLPQTQTSFTALNEESVPLRRLGKPEEVLLASNRSKAFRGVWAGPGVP